MRLGKSFDLARVRHNCLPAVKLAALVAIGIGAVHGAQTPPLLQIVSGSGVPGFADGPPDQARFSTSITGLDVDLAGNIYVTDSGNLRVRKVAPDGTVSTLAGNGTAGDVDGPGSQAQFSMWLNGVAVDGSNNAYVIDGSGGPNKIRKIDPAGIVSTFYLESHPDGATSFYSVTVNHAGEDTL